MRSWIKIHKINEKHKIEGTPCAAITSKDPELQANFETHEDAEPQSRKQGLLR